MDDLELEPDDARRRGIHALLEPFIKSLDAVAGADSRDGAEPSGLRAAPYTPHQFVNQLRVGQLEDGIRQLFAVHETAAQAARFVRAAEEYLLSEALSRGRQRAFAVLAVLLKSLETYSAMTETDEEAKLLWRVLPRVAAADQPFARTYTEVSSQIERGTYNGTGREISDALFRTLRSQVVRLRMLSGNRSRAFRRIVCTRPRQPVVRRGGRERRRHSSTIRRRDGPAVGDEPGPPQSYLSEAA